MSLPVDIVESTPDDCFTSLRLNSDELDGLTNFLRPDRQPRRADRHWNIDQDWTGDCHGHP
ncbi:MAG: hypothetical protein WA324_20645 [Bryobacteraceae bacterium]